MKKAEQAALPHRFSRIWDLLKIILAVGLIIFVLASTNFGELKTLNERINWRWLWPYIILYSILTILKAYQYGKMLDAKVSFPRMINVVIMQNGISNIIASGAGILSYLVMLREEQGISVGRSAMVFVITKIGDLFAVWIAMLISTILLWDHIPGLHGVVELLLIFMSLPLLIYSLILVFRSRFTGYLRTFLNSLGLMRISFVSQSVLGLETIVDEEQGTILQMTFTAILLSTVYFGVTLAWYVAQLRLFSITLDLLPIIFVTTMLQLISIVPITILGGLGIVESSSLYFYTLFGVDPVGFAAVLIGLRALFYLINLGLLLYIPIYSFIDSRSKKA